MLTKMYVKATTRLSEDDGITAVEYGILVAVIAVAVAAAAKVLGPAIGAAFDKGVAGMAG